MLSWFRRRRPLADAPKLKPRRERRHTARAELADIAAVAPELVPFLGQAAYLQLEAFESLSGLVAELPALAAKEAVSSAAGRALSRHQGLVALLRSHGADASAMEPFAPQIDRFRAASHGADWRETLLGVHLACGMLDDYFVRLGDGVKPSARDAVVLLENDPGDDGAVVAILAAEVAAEPALASRLALWGRRLVGDVMLIARSGLRLSGDPDTDEPHVETIFSEVVAAHTRRMDALGLTA